MRQLKTKPFAHCYAIRPLRWVRSNYSFQQEFFADVPFGSFFVSRSRRDWDDDGPWESWRWGYHFDDRGDMSSVECKSAAEGKRLAQEEWNRRILPCLRDLGTAD